MVQETLSGSYLCHLSYTNEIPRLQFRLRSFIHGSVCPHMSVSVNLESSGMEKKDCVVFLGGVETLQDLQGCHVLCD